MENKESLSFIKFDICQLYPSISEELIHKAIEYAAQFVDISAQEKEILFHTSKSVLYHKGQAWQKKGDVGMGSFDGAEKCDLIGLYLLYLLRNIKANVGLYRDDGLAACAMSGRQTEKVKKDICKVFKNEGLDIKIDANLKVVDFLDVELNLDTEKHRPFTKPNNIIQYIHTHSNHPPCIKKIP